MAVAYIVCGVVFSGGIQPVGAHVIGSYFDQSSRRLENSAMPRPDAAGDALSFLATTENSGLHLAKSAR
jgi:hypothetical protein